MTIYRRRQEFGLLGDPQNTLSDGELRTAIRELRRELPELGESMVWGRLRSMGFTVTRQRVRNAIHADDPLQTALRWRGRLTVRRPYSVPGPNSLWHIGGLPLYSTVNVYV